MTSLESSAGGRGDFDPGSAGQQQLQQALCVRPDRPKATPPQEPPALTTFFFLQHFRWHSVWVKRAEKMPFILRLSQPPCGPLKFVSQAVAPPWWGCPPPRPSCAPRVPAEAAWLGAAQTIGNLGHHETEVFSQDGTTLGTVSEAAFLPMDQAAALSPRNTI